MDVTAVRFLADRALKAIAKLDEAERRKQEEKVRQEEAEAHLQAVYFKHGLNADGSSSSQRRRKKRSRHLQFYAPGWLRWFCSSHTVSPSLVGRLELPGF